MFHKIKSKEEHDRELKELNRIIAMHYMRGNVQGSAGRFLTEEDAAKMREVALAVDISFDIVESKKSWWRRLFTFKGKVD